MTSYDYDSEGAIFSHFLLTLLSLSLMPLTYYTLFSSRTKGLQISCPCPECNVKKGYMPERMKKSPWRSYLLLLLGWLLFGYFAYNSLTLQMKEEVLWDPYRILGVDEAADERTVKKAFKKLSLLYHPDKVSEENKSDAEALFIDISKAYKVLSDPEAKAVWDEFGHPDGKQAFQLGLALPIWLVEKENANLVLLVYGLLFGVGLPILVVICSLIKGNLVEKCQID